jgi:putative FmdB family regulatory protein
MPLFEYVCIECGCADERLLRAPAPDRVRCSACGSEASRQVPLLARSAAECGAAPSSSGGT